jgi:predicted PurR-regulated permease PerM
MAERSKNGSRVRAAGRPAVTSRAEFTRRVLVVVGVAALAVVVGTMFARAYEVFFLFFLAVLLAILLRSASDAVDRRTGIGPAWSLAAVVVALLALTAAGVLAASSMIAGQLDRLTSDLPKSLDQARQYMREQEWGRVLLGHAPTAEQLAPGGTAAGRLTAFFSTTFGVLGNLVVLTFLTLYLAASPRMYVEGLVRLVPPRRRPRAEQVLNAVGFHLRWWLIGRAAAMVAVGLLTAVGLWLAGVPQFLILGLIAGLLSAVPYVGPIAAAVPGVLMALLEGPTTALWALVVYVLAQAVENYLLTPLIQQNTVELPPVLAIAAIVLFGALFGVIGLIVATPLTVTLFVLVKTLYVEDVLGDPVDVPGERAAAA